MIIEELAINQTIGPRKMLLHLSLISSIFLFSFTNAASEGEISDISEKVTLNKRRLPGKLQPDGTRCVQKVFNVQETVYDTKVECHHKLKRKCHVSYVTDYHSSPRKKCTTFFKKSCRITFRHVPHTHKVKKCYTPYEKICGEGINGPEVCSIYYENHCETRYITYDLQQDEPKCKTVEELRCNNEPVQILHIPNRSDRPRFAVKERCEKWPVQKCNVQKKNIKKVHPESQCKKIPRKICAPNNCQVFPKPELCHEVTQTRIQKIPDEECDLQPQENCLSDTNLIPKLIPKKNCVKVPKEFCVHKKTNPRKIFKPIIKNWCYDPSDLKKKISDL